MSIERERQAISRRPRGASIPSANPAAVAASRDQTPRRISCLRKPVLCRNWFFAENAKKDRLFAASQPPLCSAKSRTRATPAPQRGSR